MKSSAYSELLTLKLPDSSFWVFLTITCAVFQTFSLSSVPLMPTVGWHIFSYVAQITGSFVFFGFFPLAAILAQSQRKTFLYRMLTICALGYLLLLLANTIFYSTMGYHLNIAASMLFTGHLVDFTNTMKAAEIPQNELFKIVAMVGMAIPLSRLLYFICQIVDQRFVRNTIMTKHLISSWFIACFVLMFFQILATAHLPRATYFQIQKANAFTPQFVKFPRSPLKFKIKMKAFYPPDQYPKDTILREHASSESKKAAPIFYFIVETLRSDFVTSKIMPNLFSFKSNELSLPISRSNGNATHLSWDAMYLSSLPLYWSQTHEQPSSRGSIPLQEFKKAGFNIHVYTRAMNSTFWNAKKKYFGEPPLYDSYFEADDSVSGETDQQSLNALKTTLNQDLNTTKSLYIISIDSAHHDYFWPAKFPPKFLPFTSLTGNLNWSYSQKLADEVKNKYLNSLSYLDSLLGDFFTFLKEKELYNSSIIAVIGDHGEEFMETGFFTHGSNLYNPQINSALILKIPGVTQNNLPQVGSQADILPTLLDSVGAYEKGLFSELEGRSLLKHNSPDASFAVSFSSEGTRTPYRGVLSNSFGKLFFELDKTDPLHSTQLWITEILDPEDRPLVDVFEDPTTARELVKNHFFRHLKQVRFLSEISEH